MDNTNPGNRPLGGAPRNGGPQPPQYQRQPQQPQQQWGQPQYQQQQQWNQQPQQQWGQQPPQQQWGQQPQQQPVYEEEKKSKAGIIAAIIAVLVLIAAGVLAWGYFQQGWFNSENSANGYSSSRMTESAGSGDEEDSADGTSTSAREERDDREDSRSRPEDPQLPSNAVPVNDAARSGEPAGDFNNVYRGSDVTSEPFSLAVRDKFVEQWMDTRDGDATIEVYSTVTGQSYTMDCSDNGKYITCTGGNNAIVYIA